MPDFRMSQDEPIDYLTPQVRPARFAHRNRDVPV
jgi:hypothetical protein